MDRKRHKKHLFLYGAINVGKTTLLERAQADFGEALPCFRTTTDREGDRVVGYSLCEETPSGAVLHPIGVRDVVDGREWWYGVAETFERLGVAQMRALARDPAPLALVDELGFFESEAPLFQRAVHALLDEKSVLGVIKERDTAFLASVKARADVELIAVRPDNRETVGRVVAEWMEDTLDGQKDS